MYTHIEDNIYTIPVPLPNNPLRSLNSYVIKGDEPQPADRHGLPP